LSIAIISYREFSIVIWEYRYTTFSFLLSFDSTPSSELYLMFSKSKLSGL